MTDEIKPLAWKYYTKPLERRLEHLQNKDNQNSFDKHEISALNHVLKIVKQPKQTPIPTEIINRDFYGRIDFVRQIECFHNIKETK
jgi:hypothetical protein